MSGVRGGMLAWIQTLRGRLLVVLGAGLSVLLAAGVANVLQLQEIGRALDVVTSVYQPLATWSARASGQVARVDGDEELVRRAIGELIRRVEPLPVAADPEENTALLATRHRVEAVRAAYTAWSASPSGEGASELRDELQQLNALADGRIRAATDKAGRAQASAVRQSVLLALGSLLTCLAMLYLTFRALGPISGLTAQAQRLARGERVVPEAPGGTDEIATLASAFARMAHAVEERDRHLQALTLYLRRVLDSIGAGVAVVEDAQIRMLNPPAARLWGLQEGAPLPPLLAQLGEGRHEAIPVGDRRHDVVVRPFGEAGRILVGDDVTERLADRERLARSERLALVGQMLAQVTHEVRNPLNALSLHAELLADEVHTGEGREVLGVISREIGRLEEVTERYLDLARRRPIERAAEDPLALAQAVAHLEEETLRRAGVAIEVHGAPGQLVDMDGNVVRRALLNLLRNASESGARRVDVQVAQDGGNLTFLVADDGAGMAPEVAARVFEPFYTTRSRGTGLGLAVTRQSIEDQGGSIVCESTPGVGTRFLLRLPVTPA